jgi:uncharacterized membrane protein YeiB
LIDYLKGWNIETLQYLDFWSLEGFFRNLFYNGFHPVFPWVIFLLIGILIGRFDLTDTKIQNKLLYFSLSTAAIFELLSCLIVSGVPEDSDFVALFGRSPMPPSLIFIIIGSTTALVVIILSIKIMAYFQDIRIVKWLSITGQFALSIYVAHVVVGMGLLEAFGLLYERDLLFSFGTAIGFTLFSIIFSVFWRMKFNRGPLELVMRKITG